LGFTRLNLLITLWLECLQYNY